MHKRAPLCSGSDVPGSHRPITLNITVVFPFRHKNIKQPGYVSYKDKKQMLKRN